MSTSQTWLCPHCEEQSENVYRCTECGYDLAGQSGESQ